ncbi:MAG: leucine-rich repeat domain-containing protein [Oscillospiraceae bacterium]|nr:leucine-rich repeat domain-containing protein [Oscillospiraceae bacterium]
MAKKALFLTIVLCLVVALMTVTAFAADTVEPATGACGEGLTWTVDAQGKLTISGTGAMETYDYGSAPWYGYRDAITSVVVEGTVTGISDGAFHGFSAVVDMTLPFVGGSVRATEQIYQYPLGHIFGTASYDGGVETLQRFYWYHLEELVSNTYYIPGSLRSVTVTGGNILAGAFYNCSGLTSVDLPDGIGCIRECAFTHCESLTSVDIPEGVTRIWECAFSSCSALESVSIPDSVTWIGSSAFRGCTKLTEIVIPQNVTILEGYAFSGCSALEKVIFCGNVPQTISIPFEGITVEAYYPSDNATWTADALLDYGGTVTWVAYEPAPEIVASGSCGAEGADVEWTLDSNGLMKIFGTGDMMDYPRETVDGASCSTTPWREFCGSIVSVVIEPGVTSIGDDAFDGCNHMVDIQISEGITRIGEDAFCECSALEEVVLPGSVTNIAEGAFSACFEMRSITLPDSVVSIGKNAFRYCFALRNINIPTGLTRIEEYTFYECTALVDVVVPEGVESIGERAFELCEKLESVRLPESLTSIEWGAFCGCFKLTEINIPECLTHIGGCAFYSARLAQVTIPGSVTSIGKRAFGECKLTEIVIPESVARRAEHRCD